MSDIKLSANLFLETQELTQLIRFLGVDGYKRLAQNMLKSVGIVLVSENSANFQVSSPAAGSITVNPGIAYNADIDAIVLRQAVTLAAPNINSTYWVKISRATSSIEQGTIDISADGSVTGTGTEFTKLFRGQPNYPNKLRLLSSVNADDYEVVEVTSDTEMTVAGAIGAETGLQFAVVGAFTPGFTASEDNRLIYIYDSCNVELISADTAPTVEEGYEFLLASVTYNSLGEVVVNDLRSNYTFNSEYAGGITRPTNNELASLVSYGIGQPNRFLFEFDFGYRINTYTVATGATTNTITITSGSSHFIGTSTPPTDIFKGWKMVNLANMRSCLIDRNDGAELFSANFSNSILEASGNQLVLVPNWQNIEFRMEVQQYQGDSPIAEFTEYANCRCENVGFKHSIEKENSAYDDTMDVTFRYRLTSGDATSPWQTLALVQYTAGVDGLQYMMSTDSKINVRK